MILRHYRCEDCLEIIRLFCETIVTVNAKDYTKPQLDAWMSGAQDWQAWEKRLSHQYALVALQDQQIVDFGTLEEDKIDYLYVHHAFQRQGVASMLLDALESHAVSYQLRAYVSITAQPFFQARGYQVVAKQQAKRGGKPCHILK